VGGNTLRFEPGEGLAGPAADEFAEEMMRAAY
jgi:hypothetical protein